MVQWLEFLAFTTEGPVQLLVGELYKIPQVAVRSQKNILTSQTLFHISKNNVFVLFLRVTSRRRELGGAVLIRFQALRRKICNLLGCRRKSFFPHFSIWHGVIAFL